MNKLTEWWTNTSNLYDEKNEINWINDLNNKELSIDFHHSRWLDLFKPNYCLSDTKLLVDNPWELISIDTNNFSLDWHSNIWKLIVSPSNSENIIRAREIILDKINTLSEKLRDKLYNSRSKILKLNSFRDCFDNFNDLKYIIKELEKNKKLNIEDFNSFDSIIFWFDMTYSTIYNYWQYLPWRIYFKSSTSISSYSGKQGTYSVRCVHD